MSDLDYLNHQVSRMIAKNPEVTIGEYWEKMSGKVWRPVPKPDLSKTGIAVKLRQEGKTYREISEKLGYETHNGAAALLRKLDPAAIYQKGWRPERPPDNYGHSKLLERYQ